MTSPGAVGHTRGPWHHKRALAWDSIRDASDSVICSDEHANGNKDANFRLIAAAPTLLRNVEAVYVMLADIRHQWVGRHTSGGQALLSCLRDAICDATGREAQDVQDDYGNRLIHRASGR